MNRRLLMIAPYFPPRRRVASLRAFRFATHLSTLGWSVAVCHIRDHSQQLTSVEKSALDAIEDWGMDVPFDRTAGKGSESDLGQAKSTAGEPGLVEANLQGLQDSLSDIVDWFDRAVPVDTWAPVLMMHAPALIHKASRWNADVVWSTANPWSSHLLAATVSKTLRIPWVADFRDPWTLAEPYQMHTPRWTQVLDRQIERKILRSADAITYTARATARQMMSAFDIEESKVHTFPNSYDSRLFAQGGDYQNAETIEAQSPKRDTRKELLFFGRFRETSSARPLIHAVAQAVKQDSAILEKLVIRSASELPASDQELANALGVESVFKTFTPVPYEQASARMSMADVLLVCKPSERSEIVPAKLWDYLYTRKPILGISDNPEVHEIVNHTGTGLVLKNDEQEQIAAILQKVASEEEEIADVLTFAPDEEAINSYDASNISEELSELLESLL